MQFGKEMLYLSKADVEAIAPTPLELQEAVERVFRAKAAGRTVVKPKMALPLSDGGIFFALGSAAYEPAYGCLKWTGIGHDNEAHGLPHINSLVILNDLATGAPLAVMDANWISQHRSAAVTAVAAKHMARPDSATVGLVACGLQARSNLQALRARFPVTRVHAYGEPRETAEAFAREVTGVEVTVARTPREAVEPGDIVVTSVPQTPGLRPFLDPAWLRPGSFASLVDLGRSWLPAALETLDLVVTDDYDQSRAMMEVGRLPYRGRFDAELAEVVAGTRPGRPSAEARTTLIHPGLSIGDLAVAALLYERARATGLGAVLSR